MMKSETQYLIGELSLGPIEEIKNALALSKKYQQRHLDQVNQILDAKYKIIEENKEDQFQALNTQWL